MDSSAAQHSQSPTQRQQPQQQQHAPVVQTQQASGGGYTLFTGPMMSNGQQGYMTQLDATTAALLMNPHTAAAVAAVAAAAAQQMQHVQHNYQQQASAQQQHFQIMNSMPSGAQQIMANVHSAVSAFAPNTPASQPAPAPQPASVPSSATPSPQPGQQPQHSSQSLGQSLSQAPVAPTPGQHYAMGVPHHVANAMMGFQPGISSGLTPGVAHSTGAPVPQHTAQLNYHGVPPQSSLASQNPPSLPSISPAVTAAAVQVMAHQQAANGQFSNSILANMQNWKIDQLEAQVALMQENNQPIPQPIAMLLQDARRKEEKRTAKRVANRKSACTSRARKKALVEEMTKTNARLRRQAMILALLPDLVIAITVDGEITFCSAQVERVLRHPIDDLLGAKLTDLLVPASQEALINLVGELVAAERAATGEAAAEAQAESPVEGGDLALKTKNDRHEPGADSIGSAKPSNQSALSSSGAPVVSDQFFPLSVVKVNQSQVSGGEENSDLSASNKGGGTTTAAAGQKTAGNCDAVSPLGKAEAQGDLKKSPSKKKLGKKESSSDDSFSSSSDAKQIRKANENLSRNVRWHNEQMNQKGKAKRAHMDDVLGAFVTANNAGARLSSLQHRPSEPPQKKAKSENEDDSSSSLESLPEKGSDKKTAAQAKDGHDQNSSDDSGYRESNESAREDASSTESESSSNSPNGGRPKPLAPTCNICLIRDDLTTIWCEVTSSIRTRSLKEEISPEDAELFGGLGLGKSTTGSSEKDSSKTLGAVDSSESIEDSTKDEIKELLLCLRPIRDGDEVVHERLRFIPMASRGVGGDSSESANAVSTGGSTLQATNSSNGGSGPSGESSSPSKKRPPKKRPMAMRETSATKVSTGSSSQEDSSGSDGPATKLSRKDEESAERSVVESLMLMSNNAS